jgi:hypothetical protein
VRICGRRKARQAVTNSQRTETQILIGPRPKIFPEFVGLLFFRLLSVDLVDKLVGKYEGQRVFHGDAEFVEENLQPFLSTFSVSG